MHDLFQAYTVQHHSSNVYATLPEPNTAPGWVYGLAKSAEGMTYWWVAP